MSNLGYQQVAQVERRRWDTEAYEKKAAERKQREELAEEAAVQGSSSQNQRHNNHGDGVTAAARSDDQQKPEFQPAPADAAGPEGSQRAFLQARKGKVGNIDDRVGSTEMISVEQSAGGAAAVLMHNKKDDNVVKKTGVGWHCSVCDCFLKDSHTYLDHINGRKHQRTLGYSMRVQRSTESDLLNKLTQLQEQKKQSQQEPDELNFEKLVQDKDEQERLRKEERLRKRKERRKLQKDREGEPANKEEEDGGGAAVEEFFTVS